MLGDCVCDCDLRRARNSRSDPTSSRCQIAHPREHCARTPPQNFCASEPDPAGGARRDRTDDLLLAKQALSQLSYGPAARNACQSEFATAGPPSPRLRQGTFRSPREPKVVGLGRLELPTSRLSSARSNQLSYKPLSWRTAERARSMTIARRAQRARPRRKRNGDGEVPPMDIY